MSRWGGPAARRIAPYRPPASPDAKLKTRSPRAGAGVVRRRPRDARRPGVRSMPSRPSGASRYAGGQLDVGGVGAGSPRSGRMRRPPPRSRCSGPTWATVSRPSGLEESGHPPGLGIARAVSCVGRPRWQLPLPGRAGRRHLVAVERPPTPAGNSCCRRPPNDRRRSRSRSTRPAVPGVRPSSARRAVRRTSSISSRVGWAPAAISAEAYPAPLHSPARGRPGSR